MSVTAVGPATPLVGPFPKPRPFSLLEIPGVLVAEDNRWMNSANVIGYPDGTPGIWEACSTGTFRVKAEGDDRPQGRFDPFGVYFTLQCSTQSVGNYDRFYQQAEDALNATLSHAVEDALSKGVSLNPFFGDTGFTALAQNVSPRIGLSYLENAIGERTGRLGLIHSTPAITTAWGDEHLNHQDILTTLCGTPVADGSGYIGAHPVGSGGLPGPSGTKEWAFATGPVEVRVQSETRFSIDRTIDQTSNVVTVRAEKYVLAEWDTALQVGVLIDWSLTP